MSDVKLKPCPFCGAPAELEYDSDHHGEWFNLGCSRHWHRVEPDDACPGGRLWYTEDPEKEAAAIAAWNTRPVEDALVSALEAAEERHQKGLLNMTSEQIDRVHELRRDALTLAKGAQTNDR